MTMSGCTRIRFDVSGVVPEKRDSAMEDLQISFHSFSSGTPELACLEVTISPNFEETVGEIFKDRLGVKLEYKAARSKVRAFGKTIPYPTDNKLGIVIVLDGALIGKWQTEQGLLRLQTFTHESAHVIQDVELFRHIGREALFTEPNTVNSVLFRLAHDVWSEYYAERCSLEFLDKAVKNLQPEAVVAYPDNGYVESFIYLVEELPDFIMENIVEFRSCKTRMDAFWPKMYAHLREALVLAAFTSAHSDVSGKIHPRIVELKNNAYDFFFDVWSNIESDLRELYRNEIQYNKEILSNIARQLLILFSNCGLELKDVVTGVYVVVKPISL